MLCNVHAFILPALESWGNGISVDIAYNVPCICICAEIRAGYRIIAVLSRYELNLTFRRAADSAFHTPVVATLTAEDSRF
jgi:hypothetical protein